MFRHKLVPDLGKSSVIVGLPGKGDVDPGIAFAFGGAGTDPRVDVVRSHVEGGLTWIIHDGFRK